MITSEEIDIAQHEIYVDEDWHPLINFFWERYNNRYFDQISYLQKSQDTVIRNNCGFLITSIDFILIETLSQYYDGVDETHGQNHDPINEFFGNSVKLSSLNFDRADIGRFSGLMRCGLLHQAKTKKGSVINKRITTPIVGWIDVQDKNKGFQLNRDLFHQEVVEAYHRLIDELKFPTNIQLRSNFKKKLKSII